MTYNVSSDMIECPGGMPAFIARPEGTGRFPVVILMHERYGLVQHAKDLAQRCARDGYVVLAPNFFYRHPDQKILNAGDSRYDLTDPESVELLNAAVRAVKEKLAAQPKDMATRTACEFALESLIPVLPEMIGGSADLTGSNNTRTKTMKAMTAADFSGRFIHYGVREHGMAAAMNGMALHGGIVPYSGTFLVFSDYCRPAIRLAALMGKRVIHVMTHDSIGLGEDGPTHQPVEHLAALRAIPNLLVFRPCDAVETAECWQLALSTEARPSILALTRQNLPQLRDRFDAENICARGAYEIAGPDGKSDVSIFATGSEVAIAVDAAKLLAERGIAARVVSVPSFELFLEQSEDYRRAMIGTARLKIGVEAAVRQGWDAIIGTDGVFVGMNSFGASAPYKELYKKFGITAEAVAGAALSKLGKM